MAKTKIALMSAAFGVMLLLSSCGGTGEEQPGPHTHQYTSSVVPPGCVEEGYTEYVCKECGDSFRDSFTPAVGHDPGQWETICVSDTNTMGVERRKCRNCDYFEEVKHPMLINPDDKMTVFDLFTPETMGGEHARIPSIVTTKNGVTIAAIDRGHGYGDYGDVSLVIRRSTDGGRTWSPYQTVIDPPFGSEASVKGRFHALTIDISMTYDEPLNRVVVLTSFYPESHANWSDSKIDQGSGWAKNGGENRLILRDHTLKIKDDLQSRTYTTEYYLGSDGVVYTEDGKATEYTVPSMKNGDFWYDGTLYKNGEKAGNVFLYTGENAGELSILCLPELLVIWSDDDGQTWSNPISVNATVKPNKGETYFGVGPGIGLRTEAGRLVVPCWGGTGICTIYSDDHGQTWKRGGYVPKTADLKTTSMSESQVVEVTNKNGKKILKLFGRSNGYVYIATSADGGENWVKTYSETQLPNPDCQVAAMKLPFEIEGFEGKDLVLVSCPSRQTERKEGRVWLGVYDPETDTFDFSRSVVYDPETVWYSCFTVLPTNEIGLVYEKSVALTRFAYFRIGVLF